MNKHNKGRKMHTFIVRTLTLMALATVGGTLFHWAWNRVVVELFSLSKMSFIHGFAVEVVLLILFSTYFAVKILFEAKTKDKLNA